LGVHTDQKTLSTEEPMMTIQEMYQEIETQKLEDILNGYIEVDMYDDFYTLPDVDYTTQE
jgi:hypothetical protein